MRLFEMSREYEELFNLFDEIDEIEPDINEDGEPIDEFGNIIEDIDVWHEQIKEKWFAELVAREDEFDIKAENVAQYIKNLNVESTALGDEIKKLQARKKSKDNKIKSMKEYLKNCMLQTGRDKIETSKVKLSIRNNAESVLIDDEKKFIEEYSDTHKEYFKFKAEISKTDIKKILQSGKIIDGAKLVRDKSLLVK